MLDVLIYLISHFISYSLIKKGTKIINPNTEDAKYMINLRQIAKFVVGLGDKVSPTDIDEGMRVGVDRQKFFIQLPLPPKIDPTVALMEVEEKPDVTYDDVGGNKKSLEQLREVVEIPILHPERFVTLGIDPPKGNLLARSLIYSLAHLFINARCIVIWPSWYW